MGALLLAALRSVAAPAGPTEGLVRRCLDLPGEEGVTACQHALSVALPAGQSAALRRILAVKLADLERWEDVVDAYREGVRARPGDAETHWRLGHALLHLVGRPAEAVGPLQEAIRLRPDLVAAHGELGTALALLGRTSEAVAAFEEAVRLDPAWLESRPAAQATLEAARRGERWP